VNQDSLSSSSSRTLLASVYLVSLAFILPSFMEWMLVSFPYRPSLTNWRFGTIGLLFNSVVVSPIFGLTLAALVATLLGHRGVQRTVAILTGLIGVGLLVALPLFALDYVQLRAQVNPAGKRAFDMLSIKASITGLLMAAAALMVAWGTWRAAATPKAAKTRAAGRTAGVVVGTTPTA
jgi:hypothetical protein